MRILWSDRSFSRHQNRGKKCNSRSHSQLYFTTIPQSGKGPLIRLPILTSYQLLLMPACFFPLLAAFVAFADEKSEFFERDDLRLPNAGDMVEVVAAVEGRLVSGDGRFFRLWRPAAVRTPP